RIDDPLCTGRIGVPVREREQVVSCGTRELDAAGNPLDHTVAVLFRDCVVVEISEEYQLLYVRTAQQRVGEDLDLLLGVGLDCEAGHQRLENRLGIHEYPCGRLVLRRDEQCDRDADDGDEPSYGEPPETPQPYGVKILEQLLE